MISTLPVAHGANGPTKFVVAFVPLAVQSVSDKTSHAGIVSINWILFAVVLPWLNSVIVKVINDHDTNGVVDQLVNVFLSARS